MLTENDFVALHAATLLKLLIDKPHAAVDNVSVAVLLELLQFLKQRPEASTANILIHFKDSPAGEFLFGIAHDVFVRPNQDIRHDEN